MIDFGDIEEKLWMGVHDDLTNKRADYVDKGLIISYDPMICRYNVYYREIDLSTRNKKCCKFAIPDIHYDYEIPFFVELIVKEIERRMRISDADYAWQHANPNDFIFGHDYEYEYGAYIPSV